MYVYNYKVGGWTFEKTKWFFEKTENATHPPELTSSRFGSTIAHIRQIVYGMTNIHDGPMLVFFSRLIQDRQTLHFLRSRSTRIALVQYHNIRAGCLN